MLQLLPPLIILGLMWVLLVRPQQQRVRQQRDLVASLAVGDEVITAGGLLGHIVDLDTEIATVEVSPGVSMRFLRGAMTSRIPESSDDGDA